MFKKKNTIVFWGTGSGGLKLLQYWNFIGNNPDYFTGNDTKLWGTKIKGITVIPTYKLHNFYNLTIYIASEYYLQIEEQIRGYGLKQACFFRAVLPFYEDYNYYHQFISLKSINKYILKQRKHKICFTLDNGTVLGGIEQFVYRKEMILQKRGIEGITLIPNDKPSNSRISPYPLIKLEKKLGRTWFIQALKFFLSGDFDTVICNGPYDFYFAAFYAKKIIGSSLKIHLVCHGDCDFIYKNLIGIKKDIDQFWAVSKKIKDDLIRLGVPKNKIKMIYWRIHVPKQLQIRSYTGNGEPLLIGYAGRITVSQKRVDLFIKIAEKLRQNGVEFVFNIAGEGDYLQTFKSSIFEKKLSTYFRFWGLLSKEEILDFWHEQDIYINCAEYEGHSISQCEALSCGCIPVLTETSGVVDDVIDNKNGFISEINDIEKIVNSICYINDNKHILPIMGEFNIELMKKRRHTKDNFISFLSKKK